jgi:hypothetical protein
MIPAPMLSMILICLLVVAALFTLSRRASLKRNVEWSDLVARLRPVANLHIAQIANGYSHPTKHQIEMEPQTMYTMLGGMAGLNTMYENSKAILELAGYVTRWNFEEGTIVTERIRRDAVRLQRTILLIQLEMLVQSASPKLNFLNRAAFRIEEAAAMYHRITVSLLALYETSHMGLYPRLVEAL